MRKIFFLLLLLITFSSCYRDVKIEVEEKPSIVATDDSLVNEKIRELALKNTHVDARLEGQEKLIENLYQSQDKFTTWMTILIAIIGVGAPLFFGYKINSIEKEVKDQKNKVEEDYREFIAEMKVELRDEKRYLREEIKTMKAELASSVANLSKQVEGQIANARTQIAAKVEKMELVIASMEKTQKEVVTLKEDVSDKLEEVENSRAEVEATKAKIDEMKGDVDKTTKDVEEKASKFYEQIEIVQSEKRKTATPKNATEEQITASKLIEDGDELVEEGKKEEEKDKIIEGIGLYKRALKSDSTLVNVYDDLGYAYTILGAMTAVKKYSKDAIEAYDKYLAVEQGDYSAYNNRSLSIELYYGDEITDSQQQQAMDGYRKSADLGSQTAVRNLIVNSKDDVEKSLELFGEYCTRKFVVKLNATRAEIEKDSVFSALHGNPKFIALLDKYFDKETGKQKYK